MSKEKYTVQDIYQISDPNKTPTIEQSEIVGAPATEMMVVIAGAGSGKTDTITQRGLYLVANEMVNPEEILGLTFTRKAAAGLKERMRQGLQGLGQIPGGKTGYGEPEISTYDSFAGNILREYGSLIGVSPDYQLIPAASGWQIMNEVFNNFDLGKVDSKTLGEKNKNSIINDALTLSAQIRSQMLDLTGARESFLQLINDFTSQIEMFKKEFQISETKLANGVSAEIKEALQAIERFNYRLILLDLIELFWAEKQRLGLMAFDDQTYNVVHLVKKYAQISQMLRSRYRVVFLDEYQDTSIAQMQYLGALFNSHPVVAVGDPNQSIYGWRGAAAEAFDDFDHYFGSEKNKAKRYSLSTAFRNGANILKLANHIAYPLTLPCDSRSVQAGPSLVAANIAGRDPGQVHVTYPQTVEEELVQIVEYFKQYCPLGLRENIETTGAVLTRTNGECEAIFQAFDQAGLRAQIIVGQAFLDDPGVKLARAALEVISDIGNSDSFLALTDIFGLGVSDMRYLADNYRPLALVVNDLLEQADVLEEKLRPNWQEANSDAAGQPVLSQTGFSRLKHLATVLNKLRLQMNLPLVQLVEQAFILTGADIEALLSGSPVNPQAQKAFIDKAREWGVANPGGKLREFLTWIRISEEQDERSLNVEVQMDESKISIMTIHSAKGLEWDVVAVPWLVHKKFPSISGNIEAPKTENIAWVKSSNALPFSARADAAFLPQLEFGPQAVVEVPAKTERGKPYFYWLSAYSQRLGLRDLREELRLAYVAFTRPKMHLLLSGHWWDSSSKNRTPSFFLRQALKIKTTDPYTPQQELMDFEKFLADFSDTDPLELEKDALVEIYNPKNLQAEQCLTRQADENIGAGEKIPDYELWPQPLRCSQVEQQDLEQSAKLVEQAIGQLEGDSGEIFSQLTTFTSQIKDESLRDLAQMMAKLRVRDLAGGQKASIELPAVSAATSIAKLVHDPQGFLDNYLRPVPQKAYSSSQLGQVFHSWVESRLLEQIGSQLLERQEPVGEKNKVLGQMQERWLQWYGLHSWQVSQVEAKFTLQLGEKSHQAMVIPMRMDAILRDENQKIWIIDWKTGRAPKPEEYDTWVHQLGLYRLAYLQKYRQTPPEDVKAAYVFVGKGDRAIQLGLEEILAQLKISCYDENYVLQCKKEALQSLIQSEQISQN